MNGTIQENELWSKAFPEPKHYRFFKIGNKIWGVNDVRN